MNAALCGYARKQQLLSINLAASCQHSRSGRRCRCAFAGGLKASGEFVPGGSGSKRYTKALENIDEAKNKAVEDAYRRARNSADTLARTSGRTLGDLSYASVDTFENPRIVAPRMACAVIDRAIQVHGALGLSQDAFLAHAYAGARALRLADGPDEVHIAALAKSMLRSS